MKICILGDSLSLCSGHSKPAYELSVELVKSGIEVILITNDFDKEIKRKHFELSNKYPELKKINFIIIPKFSWSKFKQKNIIKEIENCDYFHFFSPNLFLISKLADLFPGRVIWQITSDYMTISDFYKSNFCYKEYLLHDPFKIGNLFLKHFYKYVGRKCKAVICTTKYMDARLKKIGFNTANLKYIPFGVYINTDVDKKTNAEEAYFTYMYFGWLSPIRGTLDLIDAFKKIHSKRKDVKLLIADPGDHHEQKAMLNKLGDDDCLGSVRVITWQANIGDTIKQSDVVVLPFKGTFGYSQPPLVIVEAMANCKPIISTNVGCNNELIKNGITGLLIERGDIDGLENAMMMLRDKNKGVDMGQKAFEKIQRHSWNKVISQYIDLYIA